MPALPVHPVEAPQEYIKAPSPASQRICIVDDDCDDTDILTSIIKEHNATIQLYCYHNPEEAYQFLSSLREDDLPNLIVLDFSMPLYSGLELLKKLKKTTLLNSIPKIIYSSLLREEDRVQCLEAGAVACFKKTFYLDGIKEQVKNMLSYCKPLK